MTSAAEVPKPAAGRRGSLLLGMGVSLAVPLVRWLIHLTLNYTPLAPGGAWSERAEWVADTLGWAAFDIELAVVAMAILGVVLLFIPRTRRTGAGILVATVIEVLAFVALVWWLFGHLPSFPLF